MDTSRLVLRVKRKIKVQNEIVSFLGALDVGLGYLTERLERKERENVLEWGGIHGAFRAS